MAKSQSPPVDWLPTRQSLLVRLKDLGDQKSWQDFFECYWKLIYGVAIKSGLSDFEAQDVVQETMASVAKHMPSFEYDPKLGSFKAWLLNVTRWRITDQLRKRGPISEPLRVSNDTPTGVDPISCLPDPASGQLDAVWEDEWRKNLYDAALVRVKRETDPRHFQVFDLYVNKEMPPDQVGQLFGMTANQVYVIKHRVIEAIKKEVQRLEAEML